ncbi:MAG TPA: SDR family NAD(P)-dependent oxidoreductase [Nitrococcus sp.]|nr:SDR family NAD(P)-dependent oxidoreductase [Nitrococcus sp.]
MSTCKPVSFITGASSGIGRSLARRIAHEGHAVALIARRKDLLDTLALEIELAGGTALALACDVTDAGCVADAVRTTESTLGPITRLVANAGGGEPTSIDAFAAAHIERVLILNVIGTANCIEAILPGMLARRAGHIVAMGSLAAYRGLPGAAGYSAAKAALTNMMESLRLDLRPRGIQVTLLLPGFIRTKPKRKSRPFELELEAATARMHRAILVRKSVYAFPWPLVLAAKLCRLLPPSLYDALLAGRGPKPKASVE